MSKIQKLELTWVGKDEKEEIEPRILVENPELSHVYNRDKNGQLSLINKDGDFDNMLIHGDNLLALKALEQDFADKVKCIYIDPPYNANATNVPFDDNLEHSFYLDLMRSRIAILRNLMASNGIFCMQCDYNEMAYLKVLCDEVFGRNNYITMITIKTSSESGVKVNANKPAKVSEYMLMYAKNKDEIVYKTIRIPTGYDKNYSYYVENIQDSYSDWKFSNVKDVLSKELNKDKQELTDEELREFQIRNKNRVFSVRDISDTLKQFLKVNSIDKSKIYEYKTSTGKITLLLKNGEVVFVKNKVFNIDGKEELTKIASDIWVDISWDGIANEGGVVLKNSKKPEKLIKRILDAYTNEGDIVLDSFLGSGTTCAVAHKMKRKWIGIEMGEHAYSLAKVRMDAVINGDQTGISKSVNWQGGGSYKFYELAPSLVIKDSHGYDIINPEYNANMLAAAMAKHEGFKYNPDRNNAYKQGFASEKSFIFTTTNHITAEYLDEIASNFADDEYLIINCKSFDGNIVNNYRNITIKKIPQSILGKCVFNKDNYNLNIINLPAEDDNAEK